MQGEATNLIMFTKENTYPVIIAALLGGGGSTGLNQFFEKEESREEVAQWKAIGERMTKDQVKLYILEKGCQ